MTATAVRPAGAAGGRRRLSRRLVIGLAAAVALVLIAGWIVAFSPLLGVHTVEVRGARSVSVQAIERAAAIQKGTPLLRLDTASAQRRVADLPDIASARITTSYPTTVVITVTERTPVGLVAQGRDFALVDETGRQYTVVASRPKRLPLLVLPRGAQAAATARAVATVAADLPPDLRRRLRSVQALDPSAITLLMRSGRVVQWGSADHSELKARLLPVLLHKRARQIDLSDPFQPVTR